MYSDVEEIYGVDMEKTGCDLKKRRRARGNVWCVCTTMRDINLIVRC